MDYIPGVYFSNLPFLDKNIKKIEGEKLPVIFELKINEERLNNTNSDIKGTGIILDDQSLAL